MLHLYLIPLIFALIGLAFYAVLGGADFGAGFWQLTAGKGPQAQAVHEHAHAAMAPVWEANHVWLIFVLTVVWTAYPTAFGSIASTLSIPLFIAAVGIIFRGVAYALRAGAAGPRELSAIDTVFSISSVLTPFALGTAVGGIASGRVPVGNAAGRSSAAGSTRPHCWSACSRSRRPPISPRSFSARTRPSSATKASRSDSVAAHSAQGSSPASSPSPASVSSPATPTASSMASPPEPA